MQIQNHMSGLGFHGDVHERNHVLPLVRREHHLVAVQVVIWLGRDHIIQIGEQYTIAFVAVVQKLVT